MPSNQLEIPVSGHPAPIIDWRKDGQLVKETSRLQISTTALNTILHIRHAAKEHSGQYVVTAGNSAGKDTGEIIVTVLEKPDPPTGPIRIDEISSDYVTISWEPPSYTGGCQLDNYIVEKRETTSSDWQTVSATTVRTTIKATRLKTGSEYQFRVFAENRYGKSTAVTSPIVTAQFPFSVPDAPGTPFVSTCTLHWTPPLNDGGDHVSHYILERRETSRVTWTIVDDHVDAVSYKVTKLVPGKEYIFRIAAVNKFGVGEFLESDPFIAQNPFTTPGPPSIPVASAVTGDSVILTWERPGTDGGSEIDGFIVEKRDKDGVRWTRCNRRRLNDLRFRCTGLIEGHCYQFRVLAENAAGMGEPSEPSDYIKICEAVYPPGPPTNLKVTDYSGSTVSLSWSKPIYDGGVAVIGFVVEMKEATDDEWTSCTPSTCIEETSFTVKRLRENAKYYFRIYAMNAAGIGEHVDLPEPVVAVERLEAPEIELEAVLRKIVCVRACSTLRLYINIRGRPEPEVKWLKEGSPLSERSQLEYVLTVENCCGSKSAFINVRVLDSPSAPTNLEVKEVKKDSVSISWEPPLIDGGAKISHYIVEKREEARMAFTSVCSNCERNSYKIDKLQEGGFYYFRVLAVNEFGSGLPAETAEPVKVSEVPLCPGKITLIDVTSNSAKLTWEKPEHDGGSKIISYIVEMQTKGDDAWNMCSEGRALEVTVNGLNEGNEYFFRVSALNEKGKSEPTPLLTSVKIKDTSTVPVITLLSNTFNVKAGDDLRIDVPLRGVPIPTATWKKDGNILKETSKVNVLTSDTAAHLAIKDATRSDIGMYEVTLINSVGTTSAEIIVNIFERPGPPSDLIVNDVSADFVSLSWQPPNYTGGCQISCYIVEKRDTSSTSWQTVSATVARSSIKVSRLTQGTEYQFRVASENRYGRSHFVESDTVVAQYPFKPPGPPSNLHVVQASKSAMVIAWNKPDSDGGSPVIGY
uniref:Titin n=1 Tax=Gouania willdenowi TaxID=441366 RepID=A0A8C5DN14_GOUWI